MGEPHQATPRRDPVTVVPYDPAWPTLFARERDRVTAALSPWLVAPIEHMGSTSVPGLAAKPIIDMLARIADYDQTDGMVATMARVGWVHAPEPPDRQRRTWSFCFPDAAWRTHHLHVVEDRSPDWPTWLAFRDYLRAHPADAAAYARVKTEAAEQHRLDRSAYRAGKAPFIQALLGKLP